MDNKTKSAIIVAGTIFAVGGVGMFGYWLWKKRQQQDDNVSPAYNAFSSFKDLSPSSASTVANQSDCESKCTSDFGCTSYSYNASTGDCVTSSADPYKNWSDADGWSMYIKRNSTDPVSSLSAWSSCPVNCGGTADTKQTRKCTGMCPGELERLCGQDKCMQMQREPFGTIPYPLSTADVGSTNGPTLTQCESKCIQDPYCTGIMWTYDADFGSVCTTVESKYDYLTTAASNSPYKGAVTETKVPSPSGTWAKFPNCACGQAETSRVCSTSDKPCSGPSKLKCPQTSCAYDYFMDLKSL